MIDWLRKNREDAAAASLDTADLRAKQMLSAGEGDRLVPLDPAGGEYFVLKAVARFRPLTREAA